MIGPQELESKGSSDISDYGPNYTKKDPIRSVVRPTPKEWEEIDKEGYSAWRK